MQSRAPVSSIRRRPTLGILQVDVHSVFRPAEPHTARGGARLRSAGGSATMQPAGAAGEATHGGRVRLRKGASLGRRDAAGGTDAPAHVRLLRNRLAALFGVCFPVIHPKARPGCPPAPCRCAPPRVGCIWGLIALAAHAHAVSRRVGGRPMRYHSNVLVTSHRWHIRPPSAAAPAAPAGCATGLSAGAAGAAADGSRVCHLCDFTQ